MPIRRSPPPRRLGALLCKVALALTCSGAAAAPPAWVQVQGPQLVADGKPLRLRGVNLGNWMLQEDFMFGLHGTHSQMREAMAAVLGERAAVFWNEFEEQYFTDADAAWLQARGFNLLRLPINQNRLEDPNRPGRYDEAALARIDRLIERCARHGIYVMLDLHAVNGGQSRENYADSMTGEPLFWRQADMRERATRLWEMLARRYRDNPAVAGYDLINEPNTEGRTPLLTAWLDTTLRRVRAIDRRHVIWLSGDDYGKGVLGLEPRLWRHRQLAFQFHIYPSFTYPWHKLSGYPGKADGISYDAAWLRRVLEPVIAFGRRHPTFLGETGMSLWSNPQRGAAMTAALRDMLALAEEQGWSWAQWNYKDVGQMGMLSPRRDTPWQRLVRSEAAQAVRARAAGLVTVRWSGAAAPSLPPLARSLAPDASDADLRAVTARVRRPLDELLSRAIAAPLAAMSDDELRALARSFSLANCEENPALIEPFTALTRRGAP